MSKEIDFLVKLRDAATMIADAANEYLETKSPFSKFDPNKIQWQPAEGHKGSYERSEDVNNPEFKAMLKELAAHGGKITRNGYFFWVFKNGTTVGRKKRGKAAETKAEAGSDPAQFFPENLRSLLSFEQRADMVILKPRQFLGSENFAKIADIVKQHGGDYVSQGKESYFEIPIKSS